MQVIRHLPAAILRTAFVLLHTSRQDVQISIACPRELTADSLLSVLPRDSDRTVIPGQKTLMRSACGSSV